MTKPLPTIEGEQVEVRPPRFRLIPFKEIKLGTRRRDLVQGLIPRTGLVVVYGPPKCGKTFWTTDLTMCVALGWDYRGRRVQQGAVVYCALEGQEGFMARLEAFRQAFIAEDSAHIPFYLQRTTLDLVRDHVELIEAIRRQVPENLAVVVLDTVNRSLVGSESSDEDMGAYIRAAGAIIEAFDCAVILDHHTGVEGSRPRGHSSLSGAADVQIAINRDSGGVITAKVELAKDGPQGDVIHSRLKDLQVGEDEDGAPVWSCVLIEAEPMHSTSERKLTGDASKAFQALTDALRDHGKAAIEDGPLIRAGTPVVAIDRWAEVFKGVKLRENVQPASAEKAFSRACQKLEGLGRVRVDGGQVWII